ncbi:MAG: hypothetical protein EXR99_00495 [Gemmataceae bacterium]|nr:hypothetical protein [Gemmataceae bacterium]
MLRHLFFVMALLLGFVSVSNAGNSNSLMDVSADGKKLAVANPDNGTVTLFDLETRKSLFEIPVGEKPEGVTWLGKGPYLAVAVYAEDKVAILDSLSGKTIKVIPVDDEPYGIISSPDGERIFVTHEYPGKVSEIDAKALQVVRQFEAGSMPRGIALTPDGMFLLVSEFYTASLLKIEVSTGKVAEKLTARPDDNLSRQVQVHPSRPKAFLAHIRSRVQIIDSDGSIFPQLTVCDISTRPGRKKRQAFAMDTFNGVYVVSNPWETAISPDGKMLYVIYAGTNDMNVCRIVDDDFQEIARLGQPVRLGKNPRAIRVNPNGKEVYVYNAMDFEVAIHDAATMAKREVMKSCAPPKSPEWVLGKILFNTSTPPMTQGRWVACSSCHPDGHSDARVWQNPEGLRKTPPMMGLAHTHPLHWSADRDEVQDFEYTIRGKLMRGSGLARGGLKPKAGFQKTELMENLAGRSKELDAMAIYTNSFDFSLSPEIPAPGKLSPSGQRGKELFFSASVGCASCHSGPYYSDSVLGANGKTHDVGTGNDDPLEKMGPSYDTPTLLGVYRSAPYLHHGKAATLLDVLTTQNPKGLHGKTSNLSKDQLRDLVDFLKALPYEKPPAQTPNTVQYRFIPQGK